MLSHAVLGRLVGCEVQTSFDNWLVINALSLTFLRVIGRFALIKLLLDKAVEEAEVVVKVLLVNLSFSERSAKEQVPATIS